MYSEVPPINDRQKKILKVVIDRHSMDRATVSSLSLAKTDELSKWSSATIRNDMVVLEERGYLKKEYFSSGKIPTRRGYEMYIRSLMDEYEGHDEFKAQLMAVFSRRGDSIDQMLEKCAGLISGFMDLPVVLVRSNRLHSEVLRKIDLVHMDSSRFMIYLITSSGEFIKEFIHLEHPDSRKEEDLRIGIRLLNESLCNCPIPDIKARLVDAQEALKRTVAFYEFVYDALVTKIILKKLVEEDEIMNKSVYNSKSLARHKDINAATVLELLEKYSTFSVLNENYLRTGNTLFNLEGEPDNGFALATADINLDKTTHKLSVVGPIRMNYSLIKHLLDFLSDKIREMVRE